MMTVSSHERRYLFWRSSAAPKKAAASCKIALARASSRFSLRNACTCARSSSTEPGETGRRALGGADCFNQLYNVTAFTDSFGARRSHACLRDSSGPIYSSTNLTAWSLNSGVYSFRTGISQSSQDLRGPDAKPRPVQTPAGSPLQTRTRVP